MDSAQLPQDEKKTSLLQHDAAFRQLVDEHHILDEHVRQLASQSYLSHEEQLEEVALKKRKLALKDRIEAILRHQPINAGTA